MGPESDGELAARALRGDQAAYGDLVERYQGLVLAACYRVLGSPQEAQDLAQDAFLRAYQHLDSYDGARPFGPWIQRIAINLSLNEINRNLPDQESIDDHAERLPAQRPNHPEGALLKKEAAKEVHAVMLSLPRHYRVVLELRHFQELSYKEIAEALELPMSDVKSHLFRARALLAERLRNHHEH